MSGGTLRVVLDWVPFLIFLGLLFYFLYAMRKSGGFGTRQAEYISFMKGYCSDHLEETRKINAALQRIADALEKPRP
jgi:hypothetical protein